MERLGSWQVFIVRKGQIYFKGLHVGTLLPRRVRSLRLSWALSVIGEFGSLGKDLSVRLIGVEFAPVFFMNVPL